MPTCTFLRLFANDDGVTCVDSGFSRELAKVDFAPPASPMFATRLSDASALVIVELPVGWQGGWHPRPKEQWVICLAGEMGYEAGDGTLFALRPGACILKTDSQGRVHNIWNGGAMPFRVALVHVI
jgi:quercetin dioxygenase-like cupin family protein